MRHAILIHVDLSGSDFSHVRLRGAKATDTNFGEGRGLSKSDKADLKSTEACYDFYLSTAVATLYLGE